jgi:hypothetical protein
MQPTAAQALVDPAGAEPEGSELPVGDHAVLRAGHLCDPAIEWRRGAFVVHVAG